MTLQINTYFEKTFRKLEVKIEMCQNKKTVKKAKLNLKR